MCCNNRFTSLQKESYNNNQLLGPTMCTLRCELHLHHLQEKKKALLCQISLAIKIHEVMEYILGLAG